MFVSINTVVLVFADKSFDNNLSINRFKFGLNMWRTILTGERIVVSVKVIISYPTKGRGESCVLSGFVGVGPTLLHK